MRVGDIMAIGDKIRQYRESLQMTQEDLAKALDTTPQNIYKYEKGIIVNIPLNKIQAMAKIFDTTPADLIGWNDDTLTPFDIAQARADEKNIPKIGELSDIEKNIIQLYRSNSSFRATVNNKLESLSPCSLPCDSQNLKLASNPMPKYKTEKNAEQ